MIRPLLIASLGAGLLTASGFGGPAMAARTAPALQTVADVEFLYGERAVFDVVAAPGRITDLVLEAGEALVASNSIAAGDTVRWVIGDTTSGEGAARRVHILVKPVQAGLSTNLIINTTRRTYHVDLRASQRAFLSQVRWRYPAATIAADARAAAPLVMAVAPVTLVEIPPAPGDPVVAVKPAVFNHAYRIKGTAAWRPIAVFDDGSRTYVDFGSGVVMTDLPPLFLVGEDGKTSQLVNYRVEGRRLVVDRLFARAELRMGLKRWERRVRLDRVHVAPEVGR
jgi:P-type conjugative transfer protein TrbG